MEAAIVCMPVAATVALGLIRVGWDGRRSLALAGWALAIAAAVALAMLAGAWGLAIVATTAIVAALAILLRDAWRAPRGRAAPVRSAPSIALPRPTLRSVGRRLAVFLLVVPVAAAAAALLAFGLQATLVRGRAAEADTVALMMVAQPVLWALLATVQITRASAVRMIAPALACAALGLILWWPL
ncbi:hypothetical protein GCM10011380_16780 [Sphingomonas metalli]|uniref:Uncharacterized protein n=1 Tax=Sphingomonas metalli TaxID=1779358 RepID=A0A916T4I3_9SPHN|nr:hypothetical protein [Sphingomonas metalli]GGB27811.1 hypothetical protein GCM10011380_16780 [Sphingomonas metalli]